MARIRRLPPGATIGILGGGQLGRMLALAAARLGFRCHVFSPEPDACALQVATRRTVADYTDIAALTRFAKDCGVITYEFENVPAGTAKLLSRHTTVLPDPAILQTTQDRLLEKTFVRELKISTVPFAPVSNAADLDAASAATGWPGVLKTRRLGYDGEGQRIVRSPAELKRAWQAMNGGECILEGFADFEMEVSTIAARSRDGRIAYFDVTENIHRGHILDQSIAPARISPAIARRARAVTGRIAQGLGYVGVLAVEMFVVRDGKGWSLLVNEIAPRVHNSGHWTLDGATVSQFEQHVRAIAGWPLVRPRTLGRSFMTNLIGPGALDPRRLAKFSSDALHLYGKGAARPGRKMGHVTAVTPPGRGDARRPSRLPEKATVLKPTKTSQRPRS